jgi:hypothetical protein
MFSGSIQLKTCDRPPRLGTLKATLMLSIYDKIDRAQRLVRLLEEDGPLLEMRVSNLTPERQRAVKDYAAQLTASARKELARLLEEGSYWDPNDRTPQAAD